MKRPFVAGLALALAGCQLVQPPAAAPLDLQVLPPPEMRVGAFEAAARTTAPATTVRLPDGQSQSAIPGELIVGRDPAAALPRYEGAEVGQTLPLAHSYDLVRVPAGEEAAALAFYQKAPGVTSVMLNAVIQPHAAPWVPPTRLASVGEQGAPLSEPWVPPTRLASVGEQGAPLSEPWVPPTRLASVGEQGAPLSDPLLPYQWQYGPDRADVVGGWAEIDAGLNTALASTIVAVVDSGVDPAHPDLGGNVLPGFVTTTTLDKTTAPSAASFDASIDDHGTLVAGVVGASRNTVGGAGVAPGVKILPLKDAQPVTGTITTLGLLNAITIAAYYNQADSPFAWLKNVGDGSKVSVCNVSQGIPGFFGVQAAYQDAIDNAVRHGVSVVVSVGNEASEPTVPSNSPAAIAVSVTMRYLNWELLAPYSNHGDPVFVSAPGNMIWSTSKSNAGDYSKAYKLFNGTSAAAPFVSATLALVYARYASLVPRDQDLVARIKAKLKASVDDLGPPGWDPQYGWGRVNVKKALQGTL